MPPPLLAPIILAFAPLFTSASWQRALVLLLGAPFAVRPALRLWQERVTSAAAQGWVEGTWNDLNTRANGFLDTLYLRYYDRRAPVSPTPAPTTVKPVLGSQTGSGAAVTPTTRP